MTVTGVAIVAAVVPTVYSNVNLNAHVKSAAQARLSRTAMHFADVAGVVYSASGGWTAQARETLMHLTEADGLAATILDRRGDVVVKVPPASPAESGAFETSPRSRSTALPSGRSLWASRTASCSARSRRGSRSSFDRMHLLAGVTSAVVALVVALYLAWSLSSPLRRIRAGAERMRGGQLDTRVKEGGDEEMRAVARALNSLAETLQQEEALRKESVADLAHELRTPVMGLLGRIEAAQDGVFSEQSANLEAMHGEALRLSRLLDDISSLAEAQRPGMLLERAPVDLAALAARQTAATADEFAAKSIGLVTALEPAVVDGDAGRLQQILTNLLSNALRYTDAGGRVTVRTFGDGDGAILKVEDTACASPAAWTTCSSASGAARSRAPGAPAAPGSAWRSSRASLRRTAATSPSPACPARGRPSASSCLPPADRAPASTHPLHTVPLRFRLEPRSRARHRRLQEARECRANHGTAAAKPPRRRRARSASRSATSSKAEALQDRDCTHARGGRAGHRRDRRSRGGHEPGGGSTPPTATTASSPAGNVTLPVAKVNDGKAHFYTYDANGTTVKYFVLASKDGTVRAALDACEVCYPKKLGYHQAGNSMQCNNCGKTFRSDQINVVTGGCNPIPLKRSVSGSTLTIASSSLQAGAAVLPVTGGRVTSRMDCPADRQPPRRPRRSLPGEAGGTNASSVDRLVSSSYHELGSSGLGTTRGRGWRVTDASSQRSRSRVQKRAQFQGAGRRRRLPVILAVVIVAVVAIVAASWCWAAEVRAARSVQVQNGKVVLPSAQFQDGTARFYAYDAGGTRVKFFIVSDTKGKVHVALDACEVCYPKKLGYTQIGDFM